MKLNVEGREIFAATGGKQVQHLSFLLFLATRRDGQMMEGKPMPLREASLIFVIGDDRHDVDRQCARAPAMQQTV